MTTITDYQAARERVAEPFRKLEQDMAAAIIKLLKGQSE